MNKHLARAIAAQTNRHPTEVENKYFEVWLDGRLDITLEAFIEELRIPSE